MPIEVEIRQIDPPKVVSLRHKVLWPGIPLENQLMAYDTDARTRHIGAYTHAGNLVGVLTLTLERCPIVLPGYSDVELGHQVQMHKFAVDPGYQGQGIGRRMYEHVRGLLALDLHTLAETDEADGDACERGAAAALLHFDARLSQRGLYEHLGAVVLDEKVWIKRGPGDAGPPVEYIRMGEIIRRDRRDEKQS